MDDLFRTPLEYLEFVDCDKCGAIGKWEELAPNKFRCKSCKDEIETVPCGCKDKPALAQERLSVKCGTSR